MATDKRGPEEERLKLNIDDWEEAVRIAATKKKSNESDDDDQGMIVDDKTLGPEDESE